jgi:hypothetical protein
MLASAFVAKAVLGL